MDQATATEQDGVSAVIRLGFSLPVVPHIEQYTGLWLMQEPTMRQLCGQLVHTDLSAASVGQRTVRLVEETVPLYRLEAGGVAIIDVVGTLTKYGSSFGNPLGYVGIRKALRAAIRDNKVRAIVARFEGPGGSARGVDDAARELRQAGMIKPVVSWIEDICASAHYYLASMGTRLLANAAATVGSIGTYAVVYDYSKEAADSGIVVHVISSGKFKGAGEPGTKITEEQLAEWQREVNSLHGLFVKAVSEGRRMPISAVEKLADGRVWVGEEAVRNGLVDGISDWDTVLAEARRAGDSSGRRVAASYQGVMQMNDKDVAATTKTTAVVENTMEVVENTTAEAVPANAGTPASGAAQEQMVQARQNAGADEVKQQVDAALAERDRAERERVKAIRELAGDDIPHTMVLKAIEDGVDRSAAAETFLAYSRKNRAEPVAAVHTPHYEPNMQVLAIGAALSLSAGLPVVDEGEQDQDIRRKQEEAEKLARRWKGIGPLGVCREYLRAKGVHPGYTPGETVRTALSFMFRDQVLNPVGQTFSTLDTPNVFSNTLGTALMRGFDVTDDSSRLWTSENPNVMNFLEQKRIRLSQMTSLEPLPAGGKARHKTVSEVVESYYLTRYSAQMVVDEQTIINDSMDAFSRLPRLMGAVAGRTRPDLVYSLLLANAELADGVALFHATHANLGSAVLAAAGLQAGLAAMGAQREGKAVLNILGKYLIVPSALRHTARILVESEGRYSSEGDANPLRGLGITVIPEDRIGVGGVYDPFAKIDRVGLATNWMLAADPNLAPTVEVGLLSGSGGRPIMRSWVINQGGEYGIGYDVKYDIAAKALGHEGMYWSAGA